MAVDHDEEPVRSKRGRKRVVIKSDNSDSDENYQTAYNRSKSRARSRTLEPPRFEEPPLPNFSREHQVIET